MGIGDWSMHDKVVAALSSRSSHVGPEGTSTKTGERHTILKCEIEKRCLQCSDDLFSDIASKCDGYDAYDLLSLFDKKIYSCAAMHISDFLQAMENFLPVTMQDITKPATEGGCSGWEDGGGLNDIRNATILLDYMVSPVVGKCIFLVWLQQPVHYGSSQ
ncbi:peroxisome 1 [Perilla frutescens var. hirtella]|uniref:Peroxisome 1 n=1 Tax=Perilla frutescens var. hirtella TaxID=608512 RepID=A0AAD4P072_PERFH|nr:peroxisome 1 [Perilla frutescens var. frutescens]KAH6821335.1 peroxisome 1 [Perilla frutescens var. hirtella]